MRASKSRQKKSHAPGETRRIRVAEDRPKYRIFISYTKNDAKVVVRLAKILARNGLKPMWDRDFIYGHGFHEQIRNFIAHAHVFLPVLTEKSDSRKWVHQEIGFAMAHGIPVLPLAIGELQDAAMLREIHAFETSRGLRGVEKRLSYKAIAKVISHHSENTEGLYRCADHAEARARLLAAYSNDVYDLDECGLVRQKGGLSSFHIPRHGISHPDWQKRMGKLQRSAEHCRLQREERIALEKHARAEGCRLIVNPNLDYRECGKEARIVRLRTLLEFLASMPDRKCAIAFSETMPRDDSVTLVGDWFAAESVSARLGQGYRQTIFTRHAPSLLARIEAFDLEFDQLLTEKGWTPASSRRKAMGELQTLINELEKEIEAKKAKREARSRSRRAQARKQNRS